MDCLRKTANETRDDYNQVVDSFNLRARGGY
jgi:hypothetical protein